MVMAIGPYEFSITDARRTLSHAFDLLDVYPPATRAAQPARRARLADALDGLDLVGADAGALQPVLERVWAELMSARDDLAACHLLPAAAVGEVAGVSVSDGGVPKRAVTRLEVGFTGAVGDRQATRVHHGRPWQALCLWSAEVIAGLAAEGHPIAPGSAGENVTISELDWADVRPGVRLRLGSVSCQVSAFALPCKQNARWFSDGDFQRIHHSRGPISRVYATVLAPGAIAPGDAALLEPG